MVFRGLEYFWDRRVFWFTAAFCVIMKTAGSISFQGVITKSGETDSVRPRNAEFQILRTVWIATKYQLRLCRVDIPGCVRMSGCFQDF